MFQKSLDRTLSVGCLAKNLWQLGKTGLNPCSNGLFWENLLSMGR